MTASTPIERVPTDDGAAGSRPTGARSRRTGWFVAAVVALVALRLVAIGMLLADGVDREPSVLGGDARRYEQIHDSPGTPYRDFETEYPPVIVAVIAVVHGPTTWDTVIRLVATQLALELGTAALLAWGWSRRVLLAYLVLGTPTILFPFPWVRTDLVPVFLVVASMVLAKRNRQVLAGVLAAIAVFAKFWPLAVAPLFLTLRQLRAIGAWVLTGALGTAAWVLWAGTGGIEQVFSFRGAKGWQIESLPGNVVFLTRPTDIHVEGGAWRTLVEVPDPLRFALTLASFGVVGLAWWWADRRHRGDDTAAFGLAPLASVLALLVLATIISPQYVLWFLPFAAIATVGTAQRTLGRTIGAVTLAIVALTTVEFRFIREMVLDQALAPAVLVLVRNALLVALLVLAMWGLARRHAPDEADRDDDGRDRRPGPVRASRAA